jgi:alkanesulfonate monooxygenase SsuD/methylene tetrahydromethanopterin reductase-like flavin-dependent oxidoreductase (luciferase family)
MGRGLARQEFTGFRVDMSESRERFDEAAEIIVKGLDAGFVEADGKFYKQPRVEVRPRPPSSFKGRTYMAGMSPASVEIAARLGIGCLKFSTTSWATAKAEIEAYRESFRRYHKAEAPPIVCADFIVCNEDAKKAEAYKDRYLGAYYSIVMKHYEMAGDHFAQTKGYDSYAETAKAFRSMKEQEALDAYTSANLWGTPEQIVETLRARRELIGDLDLTIGFSFGSMPYEEVWSQLRLFADKVLPEVKSWSNSTGSRGAAE